MQPPSAVLIEVADATARSLGSRAPDAVGSHRDETGHKRVDIVRYEGSPVGDARTLATIGLSERVLREPQLRMELVAGVRASVSGFEALTEAWGAAETSRAEGMEEYGRAIAEAERRLRGGER